MNTGKYTLEDVGCYVDSARGVYAINAIRDLAVSHGFDSSLGKPFDLSDYEFSNELEDEIDNHMNESYGVEGAYWGRNENGDWGLWTLEGTIQ